MSEWSDEVLQAFADGELAADEAAAVEAAMAEDAELAARVAFVRAVGAAAEDGFAAAFGPPGAAVGAVDPEPGSGLPPASGQGAWLGIVLAAAAALVVFSVWRVRRDAAPDPLASADRAASAENRFVALRCVPRNGGGWALFSDVAVQLDWDVRRRSADAEGTWTLHLVERGTPARDVVDRERDAQAVPVRLHARIEGPGEVVWDARWRGEPKTFAGREAQVLRLSEFEIDDPGLAPLICVEPRETEWLPDPDWGIRHLASGPGLQRVAPQEPGEYRIVLELRSIPCDAGRAWQTFEEPLVVESTLRIDATVGEWSEPVDGMRARLVVPRAHMRREGVHPLVLQLRNESDRVRRYNVLGVTQVEIPQPFHFNLIVDGEEWDQVDGEAPAIPSHLLMADHAPGTVRSLVVPPGSWSREGDTLASRAGDHRLQFRFQSRLLLWAANDLSIWQGEITTPPVKVAVAR